MNYQEFLDNIQSHFAEVFGPDTTLSIQQVTKNNGASYDGLIMVRPDINISPTIYLTPYYNRYLEGVSLEDIYQDILATYRRHLPKENFDTSIFTDFSCARRHIVMRLVNYEKNRALLENVPHVKYLDFAIIFYYLLHASNKTQASIMIHNEHLPLWGTNTDTLYKEALYNTPLLLPYQTDNILRFLEHRIPDELREECMPECPMYILTNLYRTNGATTLLYPHLLEELADEFEQDLIVLPSSIHEVILIPTPPTCESLEYFHHMVKEVNESQLIDEEVLSDHAYYFSRKDYKLKIAKKPIRCSKQ